MIKKQYVNVPIKYFEIKKSSGKYNSYKFSKPKSIICKISFDSKPYIEELITNNKIGLIKSDKYKLYLRGDIIYSLCTKKDAYIKALNTKNYEKDISFLFKD